MLSLIAGDPDVEHVDNRKTFAHLLTALALVGLCIYAECQMSIGWALPAFIVTGVIQYHFTVMVHHASHGGLLHPAALNRVVGELVANLVTMTVDEYRIPHNHHHQHYGFQRDPDFYSYELKPQYAS